MKHLRVRVWPDEDPNDVREVEFDAADTASPEEIHAAAVVAALSDLGYSVGQILSEDDEAEGVDFVEEPGVQGDPDAP